MVDPLKDLHNYSSEMTVSQVIKFFKRKGMDFTKTMIQNYVRVGAIDPPDGRVYRERHIKALAMIEFLKPVYSLDEIKCVFKAIDVIEDYDRFLEAFGRSCVFWGERAENETELDFLLEVTAFCAAAKRMTREMLPDEMWKINEKE
ncbi:MAG: DUF1836 domain-containing protein [Defluviitaleaceae bacterium]|nr:DUF1836 domain-containing protein [Defluviitaleaceae bacterium]